MRNAYFLCVAALQGSTRELPKWAKNSRNLLPTTEQILVPEISNSHLPINRVHGILVSTKWTDPVRLNYLSLSAGGGAVQWNI